MLACAGASAKDMAPDDITGLSIGVAYDYARGSYGSPFTTRTRTTVATVEYARDDYAFALSLPYIRQHGPVGVVFVGGRPVIVDGRPLVRNGRVVIRPVRANVVMGDVSGMGDATASFTMYAGGQELDAPLYDLKLSVKFATGDEDKGLGSGKTDYSVQGGVSQTFGDWIVAGSLGYTRIGKVPDAGMRNIAAASADAALKVGSISRVGAAWNFAQSSTKGSANVQDLTLYWSVELSRISRMQAYLLKGLADGSPDFGGGLSLTFAF
jgi:hypothetical protein